MAAEVQQRPAHSGRERQVLSAVDWRGKVTASPVTCDTPKSAFSGHSYTKKAEQQVRRGRPATAGVTPVSTPVSDTPFMRVRHIGGQALDPDQRWVASLKRRRRYPIRKVRGLALREVSSLELGN